ncbi:MAG: MaoC family dehydratase N-terminal domain-containing protein [Pseudomonadota bacterium]
MSAERKYATGKELFYDDIEIGMETPPFTFHMTEGIVTGYADAVEDPNPVYRDETAARAEGFDGIVAPPATVGMYSKITNLLGACTPKMIPPPGAIHARQVYEFSGVVRAGDVITTTGKFIDKYIKKERKYVVIESIHKNQKGEKIARGEITAIWPK